MPATQPRPTTTTWNQLRQAVLHRDNHQCQLRYPGICQGTATTADHITPHANGGPHTLDNLQAACQPCNRHKSNNPNPSATPTRTWT